MTIPGPSEHITEDNSLRQVPGLGSLAEAPISYPVPNKHEVALITGATGLLGRAVLSAFKQRGWSVYGAGFSRADGQNMFKVDLENPRDIEWMLDSSR